MASAGQSWKRIFSNGKWTQTLKLIQSGLSHTRKCSYTCISKEETLLRKKTIFNQHTRFIVTRGAVTGVKIVTPFEDHEVSDIHDGTAEGPILINNNEAEYLIVGGGLMGLALAYHLWRQIENLSPAKATKHNAPQIVVVEKDPTMKYASSSRSVASCRQQFSHPANVRLSLLSSEFFKNIKYELGLAGHEIPDVQYQPQGYLFLASEKGADTLMKNYETQIAEGAKVMLLSQDKLKEVFPWVNAEGIKLATYGVENEGWYDPCLLMNALKIKNESLGIKYIHGEVVGFKRKDLKENWEGLPMEVYFHPNGGTHPKDDNLLGAYVKLPEHDKPVYIKGSRFCNCAGPWSGEVAKMLDIGVENPHSDDPIVKTALPVVPRKRWVYTVHCPDGPVFDCPLMVDPSGVYFRREGFGGMYLCGMSPPNDEEVDHSNLEVDYDFFHQEIWPRLAKRVPVFEKLKLKSAWSGYYEYNTFDQNAIIGPHPYHSNFFFLTGFSGHGAQMAPGASKCLAELAVDGHEELCERINIGAFSFDRLIHNRPMLELNIV